MLYLLLKGLLMGFLIAVPIGPIDILCIRKTLQHGMRSGFITGMGAACGDAICGAIAAFGVAAITTFLISHNLFFQMIGGMILCIMGFRSLMRKKAVENEIIPKRALTYSFFTTFFLVITSPVTILSFIAAFAALGLELDPLNIWEPLIVTLGVFLGSSLWWLILSSGVALFKHKMNINSSFWLNSFPGWVLIFFGLLMICLIFFKIP